MNNDYNQLLEQAQWQTHYIKKLYEGFDSRLKNPTPGEQVIPGHTLEKINDSIKDLNSTIIQSNEVLAKRLAGIQNRINLIFGMIGAFYIHALWSGYFSW